MPYVTLMPTIAADPTKTLAGRRFILGLTIATVATNFRGVIVGHTRNQQEPLKNIDIDANNSLVVNRTVRKGGANDVLNVTFNEPKGSGVLAQFLNKADIKSTSSRLWIQDADDAAGVASMMSGDFLATCYFGGTITYDHNGFAQLPVQIHVDGILTFTTDVDVSS
jgi:hypothetical protein